MLKKLRIIFFYCLDIALPRFIASIPYNLALYTLKKRLSKLEGVNSWHRNSFKKGNYVFGISDLDITIMVTKTAFLKQSSQINSILKNHKKIFPFLGEVNFYEQELAEEIVPCFNYYEYVRDPELSQRIPFPSNHDLRVEKIVFILRMIYADREKLKKAIHLRQKKWKGHFRDMGYNSPDAINSKYILKELAATLNVSSELEAKVLEAATFVLTEELNEQNIYHIKLPELWKFLFPHKHIWFDFDREENFELIKGTILEKVCLRQLDWEVWGLMSQIPFLPSIDSNLINHLRRQGKASLALNGSSSTAKKVEQVIKAAQEYQQHQN